MINVFLFNIYYFFSFFSYGLMILLGLFLSFFFFFFLNFLNIKFFLFFLFFFYLFFFFGFLFSRFFFILGNFNYYFDNGFFYYFDLNLLSFKIPKVFFFSEGGNLLFGFFFGFFFSFYFFSKIKKINFLNICNKFFLLLPLVLIFGRIGCFFSGCCFGKYLLSNYDGFFLFFLLKLCDNSSILNDFFFLNTRYLKIINELNYFFSFPYQIYEILILILFSFILFFFKNKIKCYVFFPFFYSFFRIFSEEYRGDYLFEDFCFFFLNHYLYFFIFLFFFFFFW